MSLTNTLVQKLLPNPARYPVKIKKQIGTLGYDPWGFRQDSFNKAFAFFKVLSDKYFRVDVKGIDQVPATGPVLIIANHSGQLPIDGILIGCALASRNSHPRIPRAMIERFFPTVPFLGNLLNQVGAVIGDPVNCSKMLENNEAIVVFPEGVRGSGKLYKDRYQLKRFGNGFMHLAMKHDATIVPVGVVGCEETIPAVGNVKFLAKLLNIPYVPITLPFIFPAKVVLNFGEPIKFKNDALNEDMVTDRVEQVKGKIHELINKGLSERKRVF
jgi:1-acyl-sn-glycerol-3-phosphate acyltransferase